MCAESTRPARDPLREPTHGGGVKEAEHRFLDPAEKRLCLVTAAYAARKRPVSLESYMQVDRAERRHAGTATEVDCGQGESMGFAVAPAGSGYLATSL